MGGTAVLAGQYTCAFGGSPLARAYKHCNTACTHATHTPVLQTLYQKARDGTQFVDVLKAQGILPGIKVDTGLQVLPGTDGETSTQVGGQTPAVVMGGWVLACEQNPNRTHACI